MSRATLMYHAVDTLADPLLVQVTPDRLRQQFATLRRLGLRGVAMRELLAPDGPPKGVVGLTFDDGYADFATQAVPILNDFGFSATVFVVAGNLGGNNDWDPPPRRPIMTSDQVVAVHEAGHEIGSHGVRHVRLTNLSPEELDFEVRESKAVLEALIGSPVVGFCYPYGELDADSVAAVRGTYDYACGVRARAAEDRWSLPRFHVGEADGPARLGVKLAVRRGRERLQRRGS